MSTELFLAGLLIFFAAFVAAEALFSWWNSSHSKESKRVAARLRAMTAVGDTSEEDIGELVKRRARVSPDSLEGRLSKGRRTGLIHKLLIESASDWSVIGFMAFSVLLAVGTVFIMLVLRYDLVPSVLAGLLILVLPSLYLRFKRDRRRRRFEAQMPAALDMIGRALRAGHSFASALNVAGTELSEPIGPELKMTFDEINFGIPPPTALENLANRVPSQDLSFFVIAAIIQRETGGNLAEVLDSISTIIRARLKLFGKIRAISAEGKYSAVVLSVLPFITGAIIYGMNPDLTSRLWTDPLGIKMMYAGIFAIFLGIIWMRKVIRIHV